MKQINYKASYTGIKFHKSKKFVKGVLGPIGSGKSVMCIMDLMFHMCEQKPNKQGVRPTKYCIVRNTSEQLETTTYATFKQWFPDTICHYTKKPLRGYVEFPLSDGTTVKSELIFLAMDREDDARKVLSLEISGAFINEAREIKYSIVKDVQSRIGRYPSKEGDGVANTRKLLLMDTNPPDTSHWWYYLAEIGKLPTEDAEARMRNTVVFDFFRQPGALIKKEDGYEINPRAENIEFLPGGYDYYLDQLAGGQPDKIDVMLCGNYGMIKTGMPVYNEYNDQFHLAKKDLGMVEGVPVGVGWDWGRDCACVFGQVLPDGQLRVFHEIVGENTRIREFVRDQVKPFIDRNLNDVEWAFSFGDPAGVAKKGESGLSFFDIINDSYLEMDGAIYEPLNLPFHTEPAPTNIIDTRIDAVKQFMGKIITGGKPGYYLSPSCEFLRKGKMGGYSYKKINTTGILDKFANVPDKDNIYSHPADAEQYLALGFISNYGNIYSEYDNNYVLPKRKPNNSIGY